VIELRPLLPADAPAAHELSFRTFAVLDAAAGEPVPEHTDDARRAGTARIAHLQRTDPDGAWAAVDGEALVGVALASRRGPLWFLSLLTVDPDRQGAGTGRRLLDAALATMDVAGAIGSSEDPRALHRYGAAGFDLQPAFRLRGTVDRARLPVVQGVRDGSLDDDRELVDAIALEVRGAPVGPDVDAWALAGARLLVAEGPAGRGYAAVRGSSVRPLAATTPEAARALLVTALAEVEGEAYVGSVTASEQWALAVGRELRLPLSLFDVVARRGWAPAGRYVPDGVFG
jgi:GNAT superfamily N-acetyltransferase